MLTLHPAECLPLMQVIKKEISKKIWQQIYARILSHILEVNAMFHDEKKERDFVNTYVINELFRIGMNQML